MKDLLKEAEEAFEKQFIPLDVIYDEAVGRYRFPSTAITSFLKEWIERAYEMGGSLGDELCAILMDYNGETGESEGAVEVLQRLVKEIEAGRAVDKPD